MCWKKAFDTSKPPKNKSPQDDASTLTMPPLLKRAVDGGLMNHSFDLLQSAIMRWLPSFFFTKNIANFSRQPLPKEKSPRRWPSKTNSR